MNNLILRMINHVYLFNSLRNCQNVQLLNIAYEYIYIPGRSFRKDTVFYFEKQKYLKNNKKITIFWGKQKSPVLRETRYLEARY